MSERDAPRVVEPVRNQLSLQPMDLEALVADEHPVRAIWALVERLDLSEYYDEIASRGSDLPCGAVCGRRLVPARRGRCSGYATAPILRQRSRVA